MNSILIVEDHPIMLEGLSSYFEKTERWQIIGKVTNLSDAKKIIMKNHIDVLLLDIQLEEGWGIDIIPWLNQYYENLSLCSKQPIVAVYSAYDDYAHVNVALSMGVKVYMCKRRSESELENALKKALEGKVYIDDGVQTKLKTVSDLCCVLTKREKEILTLVKRGFSNKDIANNLGINFRTVENILSCVYDKTGIKSRYQLQNL